jgi:hypothetical protein
MVCPQETTVEAGAAPAGTATETTPNVNSDADNPISKLARIVAHPSPRPEPAEIAP